MKEWTNAYREALEEKRAFNVSFVITTTNGSVLTVDDSDIWEDSFKIDGSSSGDSEFQIGSCIPEKLTFDVDNRNDKYTGYNFDDATITNLILTLDMGEAVYNIPFTVYNVTEVTYSGHLISFVCYDNRIKLDKPYSEVGTSYPATLLTIVQDICSVCGLSIADTRFINYEHSCSTRPQDRYTCRDVMTMVSQIACSFVSVNRYGALEFKQYDFDLLGYGEVELDGGDFSETATYAELFADYLDTDSGMDVVAEGTYDGSAETWTLANLSWFGFNGTYPCRLKVNASSHYQFEPYGETRPDPGTGVDANTDVAIFDDGNGATKMSRLLGQAISIGGTNYYKVRFEGQAHQTSTDSTSVDMVYELFIMPNDEFFLHTITRPTAYTGYIARLKWRGATGDYWTNLLNAYYRQNAHISFHLSSAGNGWRSTADRALYSTGDTVSGGRINPWDTWYSASGGTISPVYPYGYAFDLECGMDDIVITGVQVPHKDEEGHDDPYTVGEEGYVLKLTDNVLITDDYASVAEDLGARLIGTRFRTFEGEFLNDPTVECGDTVSVIDINGVRHNSPVTTRTVTLGMAMNAACNATPPAVNSSVRNTELTRTIIGVEANAQRALTTYEQSVWMLTNMMTMGFGLYKTEEPQTDGSTIYYMHNKPTLAESTTIWKMTADAFAVSTDGGRTWNAGIDSEGNVVVNVLSAVGIVADWIRSGTLTVGGVNDQYGVIIIRDYDGVEVGTIDRYGITLGNSDEQVYCGISAARMRANEVDTWNFTIGGEWEGYNRPWLEIWNPNDEWQIDIEGAIISTQEITYTPSPLILGGEPFDGRCLALDISEYWTKEGYSWPTYGFVVFSGGDRVIEISPTYSGETEKDLRIYCDTYAMSGTSTFDEVISSGTKSRVVNDTAYGNRRLYCYETPTPYFGDIGTGRTDETGYCYVSIDSIFAETANTEIEYTVFLQKEGQGDIWVEEKTSAYFVVKGTPNLPFSWELKAVQLGFETYRLDEDSRLKLKEPEDFIESDYSEPTNFLSNDFNVEEL